VDQERLGENRVVLSIRKRCVAFLVTGSFKNVDDLAEGPGSERSSVAGAARVRDRVEFARPARRCCGETRPSLRVVGRLDGDDEKTCRPPGRRTSGFTDRRNPKPTGE